MYILFFVNTRRVYILRVLIILHNGVHIEDFKRATGRVFTTSDGHKYIKSKTNTKFTYLRCVLFKTFRCKATSKLQHDIDRIISMDQHNHGLNEYESNANEIKENSQSNLRQIFDNVTRNDPFASEVSKLNHPCIMREECCSQRFHLQLQNSVLCCLQRLLETSTSFL